MINSLRSFTPGNLKNIKQTAPALPSSSLEWRLWFYSRHASSCCCSAGERAGTQCRHLLLRQRLILVLQSVCIGTAFGERSSDYTRHTVIAIYLTLQCACVALYFWRMSPKSQQQSSAMYMLFGNQCLHTNNTTLYPRACSMRRWPAPIIPERSTSGSQQTCLPRTLPLRCMHGAEFFFSISMLQMHRYRCLTHQYNALQSTKYV